jgi:hypothetical protein
MRKHPLDREMGLAGIGRPEHRGNSGAGSPFLAERRRESHILQVFLFAGGFRHCERREAIHLAAKEDGLLRRFAPRNDEKTLNPLFGAISADCVSQCDAFEVAA